MNRSWAFKSITALTFLFIAVFNTAMAQTYEASHSTDKITAKIKTDNLVQPTVYATPEEALAAADAKVLACAQSKSCSTTARVIPVEIVVTAVLVKSSSSKAASSSSSSQISGPLKPISATASTTHGTVNIPANAIDSNPETRYESEWLTDPSWLKFDLGAPYDLGNISIDWEDSSAADFVIEGSNNNSTWVTLVSKVDAPFGSRTDELAISGKYRYLRINMTKRPAVSQWGYSIYEVRIMSAGSSSSSLSSVLSSAASSSSQAVRPQIAAVALSWQQPTQRTDNTTLPLQEICCYKVQRISPDNEVKSFQVEKGQSISMTVPLPWPVYQGDTVNVIAIDTSGLHSAPSDNAAP